MTKSQRELLANFPMSGLRRTHKNAKLLDALASAGFVEPRGNAPDVYALTEEGERAAIKVLN